jgi:hypothetical protein
MFRIPWSVGLIQSLLSNFWSLHSSAASGFCRLQIGAAIDNFDSPSFPCFSTQVVHSKVHSSFLGYFSTGGFVWCDSEASTDCGSPVGEERQQTGDLGPSCVVWFSD